MEDEMIVYKSNALIDASYRLSLLEQRILLSCISQVKHNEEVTDEVMYTISVAEIAKLSGSSSKNLYKDLANAALRLKRRDVTIEKNPNTGNKKHVRLVTGWVQSIVYAEKEGAIRLRFCKDMLPYLTQLSREFTKIPLGKMMKLKNSYSIRLFEVFTQWEQIGEYEMTVPNLRERLQLGEKYKPVKDLRTWVLEPAVSQINENTDLIVSFEPVRAGRRIKGFRFKIKNKAERSKSKPKKISKKFIEQNALPGESWDEAVCRLKQKELFPA